MLLLLLFLLLLLLFSDNNKICNRIVFFLFFARSTNYLDKDFDSTMAVAVALSANERESLFSFAALSPARHVKVQEQIVYYIII